MKILIPLIMLLVVWEAIPIIFYYFQGLFDLLEGRNIFFKYGFLKRLIIEGPFMFWKKIFFGPGRDE